MRGTWGALLSELTPHEDLASALAREIFALRQVGTGARGCAIRFINLLTLQF